ncbi:MAG TPA: efflux RND transporter permease subunit, partial [Caulifigura sp.]|nr:efflux RND transporter permease subunit [Caulifigura sp.]
LLDGSSASNAGTVFVTFKPWEERLEKGLTQERLLGEIGMKLAGIKEAIAFAFPPPAIRGLGFRAGFQMQVEDRADVGLAELQTVTNSIIEAARGQSVNGQPVFALVNSTFRPGVPQLYVDVDREKVKALDIPLATVFNTLQAYLGSAYVIDFNKFGRTYQVRLQAEPQFRADPKDIELLEVRNRAGAMIPIGSVAKIKKAFGPQIINRYNLYPSSAISGEPAQGFSSGEALRIMEQIADNNMPESIGYEWTNMSFQEKKVGNEQYLIFALAVLLVYLVLAAQYESWLLPVSVLLVVPTGVLGAIAAVFVRGMDNNLYTQIGIVLIIALASKNAILIVEFARELRIRGRSILDAAVEASKMRFRPILMTSFAFILGIVPLVVANGAGSGGQRALGTAVFGGMLVSTFLGVFFVPVFFVIIQTLEEAWLNRGGRRKQPTPHGETHTETPAGKSDSQLVPAH